MVLKIKNLNLNIKGKKILQDISMEFPKGKFIGIIGPNGAGKSTLLKTIYGIYENYSGDIFLQNKNIKKMSKKDRAKKISVVAQEENSDFDLKIEQIVEMGRYPYKKIFEEYSLEDKEIVNQMLKKTDMDKHIGRYFKNLSGGEKQRVLISRALTQDTPILILDEPTNHLDIGQQIKILNFVKNLDKTVIAALHDLNIATMFCDYIFVIKDGKIIKQGNPDEVFTEKILKNIFGLECYINKNPFSDKLQISYMVSHSY